MELGDSLEWEHQGKTYTLIFNNLYKSLGYELKLTDFVLTKQPGSTQAAAFESYVTVRKQGAHQEIPYHIFMNQPLVEGKYKIFQASYQQNMDGSEISVFTIAYDPGINIKYLGSLLLVLGICLMFYFKPLFMQRKFNRAQ